MSKKIILVAAFGVNREIGKDNALPWKIPAEMAHFRRTTMGKTILMGSKTALSIGKVLPGRKNLVLTTKGKAPFAGQIAVDSIETALKHTDGDELLIIGGQSLYEQFMPLADELIISHIDVEVPGADAFFPAIDEDVEFTQTYADVRLSNDENIPHFAIWHFRRNR